MSENVTTPASRSVLDAIDPEILDALVSRREAIARGTKVGAFTTAALALGSMPIALGALATTAYAQAAPAVVLDVLQYAFLLENLESEFYKAVLGTSSVAAFNTAFATVRETVTGNAAALGTLQTISDHEIKHVDFLRTTITTLGGTAPAYNPATTFDFTGGRGSGTGPFAGATTDLGFLLAATQGFEDTGVRAYKGQAGKLLRSDYLTPALRIHSIEARHAARIRRIRRLTAGTATDVASVRASGLIKGGTAATAGGYSGTLPPEVATAFGLIYAGDDNTIHRVNNGASDVDINAASLPGLPQGTDVTMAFDEALDALQVKTIVQPFVIPDIALGASLAQG